MNILLIAAGRRTEFVRRLKKCLLFYNPLSVLNSKVYSYELEDSVPIKTECTILPGLNWKNPEVINHLQRTIDENKINIIIPLDDYSSTLKSQLKNVNFVGSPSRVANICYDKKQFEEFFLNNKRLSCMYPDQHIEDFNQVIQKPKFGNSSKDISVHYKYNFVSPSNDDYIIQSYVNPGMEYSVDAFFDKNMNLVDAVPRERIRVAGGEVIDSRTVKNQDLIDLTKLIGQELQFSGPVCLQFIKSTKDSHYYIMEINARFGGGNTLSQEAGLDMLRFILEEHNGKEINHKAGSWKEGLLMRRTYEDFFFEEKTNNRS